MSQDPRRAFEEWARIKGDLGLAADISHSALLGRLLAGKEALPYPPPPAFSYPWYALIENGRDDRCEVWVDRDDGRIVINQSDQFELLSTIGDEHRVRYHGVEYRVWRSQPERGDWSWSIEKIAGEREDR